MVLMWWEFLLQEYLPSSALRNEKRSTRNIQFFSSEGSIPPSNIFLGSKASSWSLLSEVIVKKF